MFVTQELKGSKENGLNKPFTTVKGKLLCATQNLREVKLNDKYN